MLKYASRQKVWVWPALCGNRQYSTTKNLLGGAPPKQLTLPNTLNRFPVLINSERSDPKGRSKTKESHKDLPESRTGKDLMLLLSMVMTVVPTAWRRPVGRWRLSRPKRTSSHPTITKALLTKRGKIKFMAVKIMATKISSSSKESQPIWYCWGRQVCPRLGRSGWNGKRVLPTRLLFQKCHQTEVFKLSSPLAILENLIGGKLLAWMWDYFRNRPVHAICSNMDMIVLSLFHQFTGRGLNMNSDPYCGVPEFTLQRY